MTEDEMVAYALETQPSLLPYIPELLADLDELGSDADLIVEVLQDLDLAASARVIDLGCGKGATVVEIADELGLHVLGIDLFEPFVRSCEQLARDRAVSHLCDFVHGDVLGLAGRLEPADVAVFAALGDVLGRLDETVGVIRQYVRPGGFIVVSDAFIKTGASAQFPGFENYSGHDETLRRLQSCGDALIREVCEADGHNDCEDDESELIMARAQALAQRHPEQRDNLVEFARNQAAENDFIDANLVGAVWVLRRA